MNHSVITPWVSLRLFARDIKPGDILRGQVIARAENDGVRRLFFNLDGELIHAAGHYLDTLNFERQVKDEGAL